MDGSEGPTYQGALEPGVCLSDDGEHFAYAAKKSAWFGGLKSLVVHDEREGPKFDGVVGLSVSRRTGSVAYRGWRGSKHYVIWGAQEIGPFEACGGPALSEDGKRHAYIIKRSGKFIVMVDGVASDAFDDCMEKCLRFSADGSRVTYAAALHGQRFIVVDRERSRTYESILGPGAELSSDGMHSAFVVRRGGKQSLVVDMTEGPWHDVIGDLAFSPDGRKVAYAAGQNGRWFVVMDGVQGPDFDGLGKGTLTISRDGSRVGYVALKNGRQVVVINGVEGTEYHSIGEGTLTFSANGAHFAYVGIESSGIELRGGGLLGYHHIVVDGSERWKYPGFAEGSLAISPDGSKVSCVAPRDRRWYAFVNGDQVYSCDAFVGRPFFERDSSVRYVVRNGQSLVSVLSEV